MLRDMTLIAALAVFLAFPAAEAVARGGHGGGHGGGRIGGFHAGGSGRMGAAPAFRAGGSFARPVLAARAGGFGRPTLYPRYRFVRHYPRFVVGYGYYANSCWRWRPTPFGWRRVWVCRYPYYAYGRPYRYAW